MTNFNNKRRSFWKYLKDNGIWIPIAINFLGLLIGIMSWREHVWPVTGLAAATLLTLWIGDYITWKRRG